MASLTFKDLQEAVRTGAAARCRVTLQPAGGEGTKVFPPTYSGAVYAVEKRRLPEFSEPVDCVLLDSVQSQANRMEEALQQAIDDGTLEQAGLAIPLIDVDFNAFWDPEKQDESLADDMRLREPVGTVSSLQAPHRIADAILRDSVVAEGFEAGKPFRARKEADESSFGRLLRTVSNANATALYKLCPTALLFGMWDSTGPKGGLGAKFERALVSEIMGINATFGIRTSSRIDPLAIPKAAGPLYRRPDGSMTVDPEEAISELSKEKKPTGKKALYKKQKGKNVFHKPGEDKYPDQGAPSAANHGNIPPSFSTYTDGVDGPDVMSHPKLAFEYRMQHNQEKVSTYQKYESDWPDAKKGNIAPGGVTISHADQTTVISFAALRRLRFPIDKQQSAERNLAGQTVLAALGLCAATLAAESGLDLRSRCLLWPEQTLSWELLVKPGATNDKVELTSEAAFKLLKDAISHAEKKGLTWRKEPLRLRPSDDLVKLVVKSQELAIDDGEKE